MPKKFGPKLWIAIAIVATASAGVAWWQRHAGCRVVLPARPGRRGEQQPGKLGGAGSIARRCRGARAARLIGEPDPTVCDNAEQALTALVKRWGPDDARSARLADECRSRFADFSTLGQISALQVMAALLRLDGAKTLPAALTRSAGDMLQASRDRPELRATALVLASALLDRVSPGQWLDTCRTLAERGLGDRLPRCRLAAVQLLMRAPLQGDQALLAKIIPLLHDPQPELRRAAVVALAPAREVVSEDEILPLLHDSDIEVAHLCEAALRSRGLSEDHLELARLISDPSPPARLKVLDRLAHTSDLDPAAWLRRLSLDPSSAVRAAAVRSGSLSGEQPHQPAARHGPARPQRDGTAECGILPTAGGVTINEE